MIHRHKSLTNTASVRKSCFLRACMYIGNLYSIKLNLVTIDLQCPCLFINLLMNTKKKKINWLKCFIRVKYVSLQIKMYLNKTNHSSVFHLCSRKHCMKDWIKVSEASQPRTLENLFFFFSSLHLSVGHVNITSSIKCPALMRERQSQLFLL